MDKLLSFFIPSVENVGPCSLVLTSERNQVYLQTMSAQRNETETKQFWNCFVSVSFRCEEFYVIMTTCVFEPHIKLNRAVAVEMQLLTYSAKSVKPVTQSEASETRDNAHTW